jgi:hypothetical protein
MQEKMDAMLKEIRAGQEHLNEEMLAKLDGCLDSRHKGLPRNDRHLSGD